MPSRRLVAFALALSVSAVGARTQAAGSGLAIEVREGQLVTVTGQSTSLAALIADLCAEAGVKLRGYEAGDRPVAVSYVDVPLRDALQRLLRDETYMIGVRSNHESKGFDVAWVHVTGSKGGVTGSPVAAAATPPRAAIPPPTAVPGSMADFGFPPGLLSQALSSADAAERREATRLLAEHVEANPGVLDSFLQKDMGSTADELAKFPFAKEALQTLAIRQKDPVARAKLDATVKAMTVRAGEPSKKPSFSDLMQQGMPH